jgi:cytochrome c
VEGKLIGPGYKDVAEKYKNQVGVADILSQKIKLGGAGNWGSVPMPAHPQMTENTAKTLATWVLKGGPSK